MELLKNLWEIAKFGLDIAWKFLGIIPAAFGIKDDIGTVMVIVGIIGTYIGIKLTRK